MVKKLSISGPGDSAASEMRPYVLGLLLVTSLGLLVRALWVSAGEGFPLNDGGLFYAMIGDLRHSGYSPPEFTSYNKGDIPFAYPPLALYLAAIIHDLTTVQVVDIILLLPAIISTLTIPAFYMLSRKFSQSPGIALLATFFFAVCPRSFNWEIIGGGLTRSLGLFFAILMLYQAIQLIQTHSRWLLIKTSVYGALAVLSHLEMAWFAAFSMFYFAATYHSKRTAIDAAIVGAAVVLLTAPWWLSLTIDHGAAPFIAAATTGEHSPFSWVVLLLFDFTDEPLFPMVASLGLLGMVLSICRREYALPLWILVIFILDPRKASTVSQIPLAMLAATATAEVLIPLVKATAGGTWQPRLLVGVLVAYGTLAAIFPSRESPYIRVDLKTRNAMAWARENTASDARFLVVTASERWAVDAVSEWFPVLAERRSIATVQGTEWLEGSFKAREQAYDDLQRCASRDIACIEEWSRKNEVIFTHIFVPKGSRRIGSELWKDVPPECCAGLWRDLKASPSYRVLYDDAGGSVFEPINRRALTR